MGQQLVFAGIATLVGGCSLIFNPNNLPAQKIDAPKMDAADANPANLMLLDLFPMTIDEGAGEGGSRPAIVVLHGHNFTQQAMVTLSSGAVLGNTMVAAGGDYIALQVTATHDDAKAEGMTATITATLTELGAPSSMSLDFTVAYHDKLKAAPM